MVRMPSLLEKNRMMKACYDLIYERKKLFLSTFRYGGFGDLNRDYYWNESGKMTVRY